MEKLRANRHLLGSVSIFGLMLGSGALALISVLVQRDKGVKDAD